MSSKVSSRQSSWQSRQTVDAKKKANPPQASAPPPPPPSPRPPANRVSPRVASRQGAWQSHQAIDAKKDQHPAAHVPAVALPVPSPRQLTAELTTPVSAPVLPDPELISRLVEEAVERRLAEQVSAGVPVRPGRVMGRFGVKPSGE